MPDNAAAIAAAMKCLDDFMNANNAGDTAAARATLNFPAVRLASNTMSIEEGKGPPGPFNRALLGPEWDHTVWTRREVVHAGPDKVHIDACFTRYRKDGSEIASFDSFYVVTCENGHWGIKLRSSFAP